MKSKKCEMNNRDSNNIAKTASDELHDLFFVDEFDEYCGNLSRKICNSVL